MMKLFRSTGLLVVTAVGAWAAVASSCATASGGHPLGSAPCGESPTEPRFIPGAHAAAIAVVLRERERDSGLSDGERRLLNFEVMVLESDQYYEVRVAPRSDGRGTIGGGNSFGSEVHYHLRRSDLVLVGQNRVK